ncbi:MAG: hypothetical protein UV05_C0022G0006 [candidate division CPR1 bacterium GW2011_GWA2_42_17]|uniref:Uncharacterized protein n=1 Tax=candidate division CPR1 bacterium GW2011_GWA2_42_17 TaxID=1618341 RepID=A0A0G1C274_9BACT|nr:MAG: hypothetical protein UV05_C0022G0006 [candidate division CPR1 bacterium GW2011_GWA2_42_17]
MDILTISKKELKLAVQESVREALAKELAPLRAMFFPFVSDKEQRDIERRYDKPLRKSAKSRKMELLKNWVANGADFIAFVPVRFVWL